MENENKNLLTLEGLLHEDESADLLNLINITRLMFKQELKSIELMPGGLTNKNFRAVLEDGTQLAIRLAGKGTANYINRPGEKHNCTEM
ncbi:MAG: hypothetical protein ACI4LM_04660, partial [Anaerovoracaceae bacterium]